MAIDDTATAPNGGIGCYRLNLQHGKLFERREAKEYSKALHYIKIAAEYNDQLAVALYISEASSLASRLDLACYEALKALEGKRCKKKIWHQQVIKVSEECKSVWNELVLIGSGRASTRDEILRRAKASQAPHIRAGGLPFVRLFAPKLFRQLVLLMIEELQVAAQEAFDDIKLERTRHQDKSSNLQVEPVQKQQQKLPCRCQLKSHSDYWLTVSIAFIWRSRLGVTAIQAIKRAEE